MLYDFVSRLHGFFVYKVPEVSSRDLMGGPGNDHGEEETKQEAIGEVGMENHEGNKEGEAEQAEEEEKEHDSIVDPATLISEEQEDQDEKLEPGEALDPAEQADRNLAASLQEEEFVETGISNDGLGNAVTESDLKQKRIQELKARLASLKSQQHQKLGSAYKDMWVFVGLRFSL